MAATLFGNENLKSDSSQILAANVLTLFCKDTEIEPAFSGTNVRGFDFGFCNYTKTVQTDVGICSGSNPNLYMFNGNILQQDISKKIDDGLKDVEHIMILLVDKFGVKERSSFEVKHFCKTELHSPFIKTNAV